MARSGGSARDERDRHPRRRRGPSTSRPRTTLRPDEEAAVERVPWWQRFVTGSTTSIGLILVALIVVFSVLEYQSFVSASNARNIATDAAVLLVLATGMTYVIITAGIDLSVGAVVVFSGVDRRQGDERGRRRQLGHDRRRPRRSRSPRAPPGAS